MTGLPASTFAAAHHVARALQAVYAAQASVAILAMTEAVLLQRFRKVQMRMNSEPILASKGHPR
jgi:hypothetical protein